MIYELFDIKCYNEDNVLYLCCGFFVLIDRLNLFVKRMNKKNVRCIWKCLISLIIFIICIL